jgi:hypothetical protein
VSFSKLLLEKAFFSASNNFWQLEKLSDFRNYFFFFQNLKATGIRCLPKVSSAILAPEEGN